MNVRTALITGASRGIGRACALALAASGHRLILAARSLDKLEETAAEARKLGVETFVVEMDLSDHSSVTAAITKASKEFGRVDVLVNNGGITKDGLAMRMKQADWQEVLDTNLSGSFF